MTSVPLKELPREVSQPCIRLRDELIDLLGSDLVALWGYGAATFSDRPKKLGDVDTHALLTRVSDRHIATTIDRIHESSAQESGVEWDSWYILEADARGAEPPTHCFRADLVDDAWALHRAHWLAGRYVHLHGLTPEEIVEPPTWAELHEGLEEELAYINRKLARGEDGPAHAAFSVWNSCRIIYSLETRDVVVSKRAAATWALKNLPSSWHEAIWASGRVYDDEPNEDDAGVLRSVLPKIVTATNDRFATTA